MDQSQSEITDRPQSGLTVKEEIISSTKDTEKRDSIFSGTSNFTVNPERTMPPGLENYITKKIEVKPSGEFENNVSVCRYDNDDLLLAVGLENGTIRLIMTETGKTFGDIKLGGESKSAILNIKWRPTVNQDLTDHVFMASDASGYLYHIHATSKKILHTLHDDKNQVYSFDFNVDGSKFATGGRDNIVRVYDEKKKSNVVALEESDDIPMHTNRILSMKFSKDYPDLLFTGSWDQTLKVWDLRVGKVVKSIYGLNVYGDCLDTSKDLLLCGNYRDEDQLQLYDIGTMKLIQNIQYDPRVKKYKNSYITACQFSKTTSNYIVAASGGMTEIRVFDRKKDNEFCAIELTQETTFSIDFSNKSDTYIHAGDGKYLMMSTIS